MKMLPRAVVTLLTCSLLFTGCDSVDLGPKREIPSEQVWKDPALVKGYLHDIYDGVGFGFGSPTTSGATDEAVFTHGWGVPPVRMSNMTPTNRGIWGIGWRDTFRRFDWAHVYGKVRDLNTFLRRVEKSEEIGSSTKEVLMGEAYFLRAYYYHNLMRVHGGVPLIANVFELKDDLEAYQVPRNTFKETVNFIVADLDSAAARLPLEARKGGTATKGAALGLKSRVLLFAASELYNNSPFTGSKAKFVAYEGGSQQDRWQRALDAAQAVIDLDQYSLEQVSSAREYHELFTKGNESGMIWGRYFDQATGSDYQGQHDIVLWSSPNGYNGWGGDTPTQQHVNAYEMADGSQFEWEGGDPVSADEPIDVENPYDDRDPRFYANIMYNGDDWRARPPGSQNFDPKGIIQTGWYEDPDQGGSPSSGIQGELHSGLDTREGPIGSWNGTKTGYYVAKFVSRDVLPRREKAYNPWPFIRYAEILLNKAEAAANLGQTGTAVQALNKVRGRVGMPPVPEDGGPNRTLMERIRQEREVELAYEEHRYFDIRRWMIASEIMRESGRGVRIEGELDSDGEMLVNNRYDYKYNVIDVEQRHWEDRNYFVPIPKTEMNRNPDLVQNPGY
jgi:hypothetical protein